MQTSLARRARSAPTLIHFCLNHPLVTSRAVKRFFRTNRSPILQPHLNFRPRILHHHGPRHTGVTSDHCTPSSPLTSITTTPTLTTASPEHTQTHTHLQRGGHAPHRRDGPSAKVRAEAAASVPWATIVPRARAPPCIS